MVSLFIFLCTFLSCVYPMEQVEPKTLIELPAEVRHEIVTKLAQLSSDKDKARSLISYSKACIISNTDIKESSVIQRLLKDLKKHLPVRPTWKNGWGFTGGWRNLGPVIITSIVGCNIALIFWINLYDYLNQTHLNGTCTDWSRATCPRPPFFEDRSGDIFAPIFIY